MGFFEKPLFDFNKDGKTDCMEWSIGMQMTASSSQEKIGSTEDDAFYSASDDLEDEDILELYGLDRDELDMMDEDERREALEEVGLDPDDYEEY